MAKLSVIFAIAVVIVTALTAPQATAQSFFGGGVVAYDPEIATVSSGVVLDVQPVVSHDNKYVTINAQVQDNRVIALHNFQVAGAQAAGPAQGFVGNAAPSPSAPGPVVSASPEEIDRRAIATRSILARRGMFLLRVN